MAYARHAAAREIEKRTRRLMPKRLKPDVDLRDLSVVGPLLDSSAKAYYGKGASFCLRKQRPRGPITLRFEYAGDQKSLAVGVHNITDAIRATFADLQDTTEHGAYGVALLVGAAQLGVKFAERSYKGPGFDFYLTPPQAGDHDADDIFADKWALEVSGILSGGDDEILARLQRKRRQVSAARKLQPTLIAIVEFSEAASIFELQ